jgi:hypothetical protein
MASHRGRGKGKALDRSGPWSEYNWDARGFYISSRYGPTGKIEYNYRYPDSSTPISGESIPQTGQEIVQGYNSMCSIRTCSQLILTLE